MYGNFCLCPSLWYKHLYPQSHIYYNTFIRIHLLQLKIQNIWMKFFWNQKVFHLVIKEISTLKSWYQLLLIKLCADISDSSFVLDSLSKAELFPNFSTGNSFLFFKRFWNVRLSGRYHFISYYKFSCLKKANIIIFNFSVLQHR